MKTFILVLVLLLLLSSGCTSFYHQRYPVIPEVEKPLLYDLTGSDIECLDDNVEKMIILNFESLLTYAKKLQVSVDQYNAIAEQKNKEVLGNR